MCPVTQCRHLQSYTISLIYKYHNKYWSVHRPSTKRYHIFSTHPVSHAAVFGLYTASWHQPQTSRDDKYPSRHRQPRHQEVMDIITGCVSSGVLRAGHLHEGDLSTTRHPETQDFQWLSTPSLGGLNALLRALSLCELCGCWQDATYGWKTVSWKPVCMLKVGQISTQCLWFDPSLRWNLNTRHISYDCHCLNGEPRHAQFGLLKCYFCIL